ncbi:Crotonobetainyl-CoA:carnitine CoA-transferase CaiB [Leifsonia sp. 98AMF]|uniref:CaiB/BaiF CoA transferase family protein n=1 Tax=unclassified Leifsonia TaxID=2663824 RepID=UPI00087DF0C8|nr:MULTISPECIES: CoA transferase [unclassified Leifsonia]SDH30735.1 Crotonobetainyl-CoA:carnitine CoA-transferase CaiB [Leifsonia sp. 197AMF]SDJ04038.1 Crotonobetainyl-CoA:carnitine CoA-transferase CaiB [Leifsonia sp. 466MF]SDJ68575.1 Crotonobetainyl-CoA:carnitine CoA-transferase CaiB [Leifsonia sp. 157MF]SDO07905.1 Crotonobetainyl-CoA:carnitine CoA-transferase CaiB [Leifsonia sp. 509MF]SEM95952.1 Crotonobetainyl-CoA:carnitine CoA-transferase CaiB [Leifsonia sp. 467MF]
MADDRGPTPEKPEAGVLSGVRVADFSRVLAGPYATMMLADFGADVIKIESPTGDDTRAWRPPVDDAGESTYFGSVNRNKRSVVCDLSTPDGLATARRLASTADVVIENFRPGVMERFGLDEQTLRETNPRLVFCSITGFGRDAGAALPGYDLLVQAVGGLMSITGAPDGEPSKVGVALVDVLTGLNAFSGILLALRQRDATGRGSRVDVDLLGSLLAALTNQASGTLATGRSPARLGNAHPSIAPYELFRAADRELVVAVGNDRQFAAFAGVLGRPGLADDERFATNEARVRDRGALRGILEPLLAFRTAADWVDALTRARVPAGLVNDIGEAFAFAESLGLEPVVTSVDPETGRTSRQPATPIRLDTAPAVHRTPPPLLGAHEARWTDER